MVVGEYEGHGVWRVAAHECEGAIFGVLLACARNGGINNNVNICASNGGRGALGRLRIAKVGGRSGGRE